MWVLEQIPRAAYLMDRFMHHIGVHGKTIIPILLGFGCSVPAITATSIMETEKEKRRAIIIASMIPCSAVTTIVMGLVAKYMGIGYALLLYLINFVIIILVGKYLTKHDVSEESELIIQQSSTSQAHPHHSSSEEKDGCWAPDASSTGPDSMPCWLKQHKGLNIWPSDPFPPADLGFSAFAPRDRRGALIPPSQAEVELVRLAH